MLTDIEIALQAKMLPIMEVAKKLGIDEDYLVLFGKYKCKINDDLYNSLKDKKDGKLILVTAINPTPAGEGKTTTTVGLGQAMKKIGKNAVIALREPSLGPVFGVKGGACGGGYAQVVPMEDINLHFTGDMHAITSANNLLCALIDNHLQQGNELKIDPRRILFKRCLDINDRALRYVNVGLGGKTNGIPREDGFQITVASEVMAILCLCNDLTDLKMRLSKILIAFTYDNTPIYAGDLSAQGAMATLLKDAIMPNLVQTLDNTPAIIHGGPFANIAHGCNSIRATRLALKLGDYTITEAGFGSDLGAEKFLDIKCALNGLKPDCVVIVSTIRALKYNGGVDKSELCIENINALTNGSANLLVHIENMTKYNLPVVVALNVFPTDTKAEIECLTKICNKYNVDIALSEVFTNGADGGIALAKTVCATIDKGTANFKPLYDYNLPIKEKIDIIAKNIYRAGKITYTAQANKSLAEIEKLGLDKMPVCIAKTQYSLSDDATLLGAPSGFNMTIRDLKASVGAGFIVVYTGDIMTMPGLPKNPAAINIDVDEDGVKGLF